MLYSSSAVTLRTIAGELAARCREAREAAKIVSVPGSKGKPDFWPEGQSDKTLSDIKRWWPESLILFTDGTFGYTQTDGEAARRPASQRPTAHLCCQGTNSFTELCT